MKDDIPLGQRFFISFLACIFAIWIGTGQAKAPDNFKAEVLAVNGGVLMAAIPPHFNAQIAILAGFEPKKVSEVVARVSAYNNLPEQTDDTPNIMANGNMVYEGAVANNCLLFGTAVEINGKVYSVEDRMNKRYGCEYFDIFTFSYDEAVKFGRQKLSIKIYEI